jgi:hypothetical protein
MLKQKHIAAISGPYRGTSRHMRRNEIDTCVWFSGDTQRLYADLALTANPEGTAPTY